MGTRIFMLGLFSLAFSTAVVSSRTWAIAVLLVLAAILGFVLGRGSAQRRGGVISPERSPVRPPARPRLVALGGCRECGAYIGEGHTGYCSRSAMRGGAGGVVTQEDLHW